MKLFILECKTWFRGTVKEILQKIILVWTAVFWAHHLVQIAKPYRNKAYWNCNLKKSQFQDLLRTFWVNQYFWNKWPFLNLMFNEMEVFVMIYFKRMVFFPTIWHPATNFCFYTEYQRFEKKEILWQKAWGLNPWHLFTEPRLYPLSHQDHVCNQLCLGNWLQQVVTLSWTQLTNWIIVCFDDCLTCNNELSLICFGKVNCLRRIQTCCCS